MKIPYEKHVITFVVKNNKGALPITYTTDDREKNVINSKKKRRIKMSRQTTTTR